jgi:predicted ArsR family transcriptional regulator
MGRQKYPKGHIETSILAYLEKNTYMTVNELTDRISISAWTIRKKLMELQLKGKIERRMIIVPTPVGAAVRTYIYFLEGNDPGDLSIRSWKR